MELLGKGRDTSEYSACRIPWCSRAAQDSFMAVQKPPKAVDVRSQSGHAGYSDQL